MGVHPPLYKDEDEDGGMRLRMCLGYGEWELEW